MRRRILAATSAVTLIAGMPIAATGAQPPGGVQKVAAAEPNAGDYPASEGWMWVDERIRYSAGQACSGPVIEHYRTHTRISLNGKVVTDPSTAPQNGDQVRQESPDAVTTFIRPRAMRITRIADGSAVGRVVNGGKDLRFTGYGRNYFLGSGVRGIIFTDGVQRFVLADYQSNRSPVRNLRIVRGSAYEVCRMLGLRPVRGENPAPPPQRALARLDGGA
jgi:hypothetical protein